MSRLNRLASRVKMSASAATARAGVIAEVWNDCIANTRSEQLQTNFTVGAARKRSGRVDSRTLSITSILRKAFKELDGTATHT
eukprot:14077915-Heterocapsa_arctica.AAC.1